MVKKLERIEKAYLAVFHRLCFPRLKRPHWHAVDFKGGQSFGE
jgi:hypothetical protein